MQRMDKENIEFLEYSPILKKLYESKELVDGNGKKHTIQGLTTINSIKLIREIILNEKPSSTLEIGLAYGGSALTFLSTLKEINSEDFFHIAIDPFQKEYYGDLACQLICEAKLQDHFKILRNKSYLEMVNLIKSKSKFDLIYIDGSHLFDEVFLDLFYSTILLNVNGIVLFDDCVDPDVKKVINFLENNCKSHYVEIDYKKYNNSRKSLKKSLANFLGYRQIKGYKKISEDQRSWESSPLKRF